MENFTPSFTAVYDVLATYGWTGASFLWFNLFKLHRDVHVSEQCMCVCVSEAWPPCVRVTVVRSPVLETGTLFILTADTVATFGRSVQHLRMFRCVLNLWDLMCIFVSACREKDMNHAIRIPEMGVSKVNDTEIHKTQLLWLQISVSSVLGIYVNARVYYTNE